MKGFTLKVNDRIEVVVNEKPYKALIMDVEDDSMRINLPVYEGDYLMLHSGEKIEMNSYLDEGGCFNFYSTVISRGKEGSIIYYKVSLPFDIKKIQRRNFFRVSVLDTVEYKIITDIDEEDFDNIPYEEGTMVNLSGGGLKLKLKRDIKESDLILINLRLSKIQAEIKCDIVRIENTADKEKLCGLRFIDITPAQSEKIIQELFEISRRQRTNL
ncbi:pilus assembly protein PilZ [Clostridium chromiireducens]|uniref:Pilus assembly protein PilZ n=1 Tax=Clostridium chromiireducens TaxID=225345 RepID=A0A399IT31_9CLOT|nr:PilZ domain-containing protein [Clostridium chromiireducens]MVX62543.1 pilus assembly protein PilZ [Clostridium chromiireducens]RII36164.1 pilus assembly protein PilZ [Clostridium chromiireducens]